MAFFHLIGLSRLSIIQDIVRQICSTESSCASTLVLSVDLASDGTSGELDGVRVGEEGLGVRLKLGDREAGTTVGYSASTLLCPMDCLYTHFRC